LDILRKECSSEEIQDLPEKFHEEVKEFVKELTKEAEKEEGVRKKLILREIDLVKRIVDELKEIRSKKGSRYEEMKEEVFEKVGNGISETRDVESKERGEKVKRVPETILVRMLEDVPEFIGIDLETYGPYSKEEIALIPKENARLLIKKGLAVPVLRGEES